MLLRKIFGVFLVSISLTTLGRTADSRPDVSQIISKSDAATILGEPVREPNPRNGDGTDGYYSKCNYYGTKGGKSLIIRLQLPCPKAIPPPKQLERVRFRSPVQPQLPRVGAPTRAGERPTDVHRGPIAGKETREDECRRPVLRASRAHRAKSCKEAREVPCHLAHAVPARRSKVVRVNRAGRPGSLGSHPFHNSKIWSLRK